MARPGGAPENMRPAKKGEVRNPTGKGGWSMSIRTLCRKTLTEQDGQAVVEMLSKMAKGGDVKAIQLLIEYLYKKDDSVEINLTIDDATDRLLARIKDQ